MFYATTGMKRKTEPSCFVVLEKDPITVPFPFVFFSKVEFALHWMACGQSVKSRKGHLFRRRGMPFSKTLRDLFEAVLRYHRNEAQNRAQLFCSALEGANHRSLTVCFLL